MMMMITSTITMVATITTMHYVCEPDELTCPAGDAPFELAERRKEKQRQEDMYKRKNPTR